MCDDESTTAIPGWGPPAIAFLSSIVRGLTGFGDGITYQTLWALAGAVGWLPSNSCPDVLRRTVLYAVLMQALTMPLQLWQSRGALRTIAGYAGVMVAAGALCVVAGASFLLSGDPSGVRAVAGVVFLVFSVTQLGARARRVVAARAAAAGVRTAAVSAREAAVGLRGAATGAVARADAAGTDASARAGSRAGSAGAAALSSAAGGGCKRAAVGASAGRSDDGSACDAERSGLLADASGLRVDGGLLAAASGLREDDARLTDGSTGRGDSTGRACGELAGGGAYSTGLSGDAPSVPSATAVLDGCGVGVAARAESRDGSAGHAGEVGEAAKHHLGGESATAPCGVGSSTEASGTGSSATAPRGAPGVATGELTGLVELAELGGGLDVSTRGSHMAEARVDPCAVAAGSARVDPRTFVAGAARIDLRTAIAGPARIDQRTATAGPARIDLRAVVAGSGPHASPLNPPVLLHAGPPSSHEDAEAERASLVVMKPAPSLGPAQPPLWRASTAGAAPSPATKHAAASTADTPATTDTPATPTPAPTHTATPPAPGQWRRTHCGCPPPPPAWFPALSPTWPPAAMLALLVPAAMLGGALGGLTGAGGPPLMAAYSLLALPKDTLRGFGVVPSAFMLARLAVYTGGAGSVFDPSPSGELGVYAGILAAALAGSVAGDRLRRHLDADAIVGLLLALVFVGSGLMLRVFKEPAVTVAYGVVVGVGGLVFAGAWVAVGKRR